MKRKRVLTPVLFVSLTALTTAALLASPASQVEVRSEASKSAVEIWIGGRLFTSYQYGSPFQMKPIFYPVLSGEGQMVNRELPYIRDSGETKDHRHHESLFMSYGDVDGKDFWSHRTGEKIVHKAILAARGGEIGTLDLLLEWQTAAGEAVVREIRKVQFGGTEDCRWMDHQIELRSAGGELTFNDTKEGMFALRLADALREEEGSGRYENAFGWEKSDQIWGKRSPWVALRGRLGEEPITVAIFEHPTSLRYPSYWHARGYGLFAVNPFGRKDFVKDAEPLNLRLGPEDAFRFRYRVLIYQGKVPKETLDQDYWDYIQ